MVTWQSARSPRASREVLDQHVSLRRHVMSLGARKLQVCHWVEAINRGLFLLLHARDRGVSGPQAARHLRSGAQSGVLELAVVQDRPVSCGKNSYLGMRLRTGRPQTVRVLCAQSSFICEQLDDVFKKRPLDTALPLFPTSTGATKR